MAALASGLALSTTTVSMSNLCRPLRHQIYAGQALAQQIAHVVGADDNCQAPALAHGAHPDADVVDGCCHADKLCG